MSLSANYLRGKRSGVCGEVGRRKGALFGSILVSNVLSIEERRGDRSEHDRIVTEASRDLRSCDLVALAQYSMAPAAAFVAEATGRPVLTTPDSAVSKLKSALSVKM